MFKAQLSSQTQKRLKPPHISKLSKRLTQGRIDKYQKLESKTIWKVTLRSNLSKLLRLMLRIEKKETIISSHRFKTYHLCLLKGGSHKQLSTRRKSPSCIIWNSRMTSLTLFLEFKGMRRELGSAKAYTLTISPYPIRALLPKRLKRQKSKSTEMIQKAQGALSHKF